VQAEAAFRTVKSDLGLRPVYHQKQDRVQAHILVCFLALALWCHWPLQNRPVLATSKPATQRVGW